MLTKYEAATLRAAMSYMQGIGVRVDGCLQSDVDAALAAIDREEEKDEPPQLNGMVLCPLVDANGKLTHIRGEFRDCPGLFWMLSTTAASELRFGLAYLLSVRNWAAYNQEHGWIHRDNP